MAPTNRRPGRPTQAEVKRLDQQLREAALQTFLEYGYDGTSMEAIARAAGITKQTLYSRFSDKRAVFADVIPWAMSRHDHHDTMAWIDSGDLRESLTDIAHKALEWSTNPQIVRLQRIAMNESARFPEFAVSGETMRWSPRLRAVMDLLRRHVEIGEIEIDPEELELAAEHFLALVEALPSRLAEFGIFRSDAQAERHLQYAVKLFLRAVTPQSTSAPAAHQHPPARRVKKVGSTAPKPRPTARQHDGV
ncbi:TetR/AcrR family transcriptional regulator [Mycobacterium sp. 48b]|uniref:TetR/AcrR family transcriptional regulator n=1 Tax=Mycobacterium sp. 48b TaxID=3400426 RepID=UPI003AB012FB